MVMNILRCGAKRRKIMATFLTEYPSIDGMMGGKVEAKTFEEAQKKADNNNRQEKVIGQQCLMIPVWVFQILSLFGLYDLYSNIFWKD